MLVIFAGICLAVLDATLINIALPTIASDLQVGASAAVWVINSYQIAIIVAILPLATLGDKVGYRRVYRIGMVIFVLASFACSQADSVTQLGIFRAVQGLGAAGVMSVNAALVRLIYPRARLARGIALNAFVVAAASAAGPTIAAGVLAVASWQWLFLINVPLGVLTLAGALKFLPASAKAAAPFDLASALLSVLSFGLVFVGVDSLGHLDFSVTTFGILGAGLVIGFFFVRRQMHLPLPLLPVDLLRIPVFALSIGTSVCSFAAQMIAFISLPFFLQNTLGHSAVETGLLMTPWPLALMVIAPVSARLLDRYPAGLLGAIGLAIATIFRPQWARFTAPAYALLEGLVVGAISKVYETYFDGIVLQAIGATVAVLAVMLFLHATRIIKVTDRFRTVVVAATGAIFLVYMVDMVLRLFGANVPFIHETGGIGILISVAIVIVAALNLSLDFDFIERGVKAGAPKATEWFAGFGLLLTLVWLYLEMLRLLSKLQSRN
ncbi:MAG: Bax inhibitor-1/YccA family protein [Acidimicrobiales bacterium]